MLFVNEIAEIVHGLIYLLITILLFFKVLLINLMALLIKI